MVWLVNWEPEKKKDDSDKDDVGKKVRKEIEDLFKTLEAQARTFKSEDAIPPLNTAHVKVMEILNKHLD